jgi:hypothetical protein
MCLRRAPEKYIAGAALDRAGLHNVGSSTSHNRTGRSSFSNETSQITSQTRSTISCAVERWTCLAHGWQHHIGRNWHNRAPTSGEYTITPEDGRVRPKHVDD